MDTLRSGIHIMIMIWHLYKKKKLRFTKILSVFFSKLFSFGKKNRKLARGGGAFPAAFSAIRQYQEHEHINTLYVKKKFLILTWLTEKRSKNDHSPQKKPTADLGGNRKEAQLSGKEWESDNAAGWNETIRLKSDH